MQLLPTTITSTGTLTEQYLATFSRQDDTLSSFSDTLANYEESNAYATDSVEPLVVAPYNLTSTNNVSYTADEVLFTQKDLRDLELALQKEGAPSESLEGLRELADQPEGATLGQVLAVLQNPNAPEALSENDLQTLEALFKKLDPKGELGNTILGHINGGNGLKALESMLDAMDNLPTGQRLDISKTEMATLAKALGLSDQSKAQLAGSFGPFESLSLNKADVASILAPAYKEFNDAAANQEKLGKALDATLGPILKKAKDRMEAEKAATELSSRRTEQSKVYIEETVLEKVNANLSNTHAAQAQQESQGEIVQSEQAFLADKQAQSEQSNDALVQENTQQNTKNTSTTADVSKNISKESVQSTLQDVAKNLVKEQNTTQEISNDTADQVPVAALKNSNSSENKFGDTPRDASKDSLKDMLKNAVFANISKSEIREVHTTAANSANSIQTPVLGIGGLAQANTTNTALQQNVQNANQQGFLSRQAASQVERAMLSAAADGTKRIDLQLHPAELGTLTISLTARNGEISALIRTDRTETTDLIHKQLEHIRASLEEQGLKVDKLEVQNQTSENSSQKDMWDNMQEHNSRQEENTRRETLEQLKTLAKMRNNARNESLNSLEHIMQEDMHNGIQSATNAAQSVYIVT